VFSSLRIEDTIRLWIFISTQIVAAAVAGVVQVIEGKKDKIKAPRAEPRAERGWVEIDGGKNHREK
jgi:hypothetical protein